MGLRGEHGAGEFGAALFEGVEPFLQLVAPRVPAFHDHNDVVQEARVSEQNGFSRDTPSSITIRS